MSCKNSERVVVCTGGDIASVPKVGTFGTFEFVILGDPEEDGTVCDRSVSNTRLRESCCVFVAALRRKWSPVIEGRRALVGSTSASARRASTTYSVERKVHEFKNTSNFSTAVEVSRNATRAFSV
jgi:hypothetical protein